MLLVVGLYCRWPQTNVIVGRWETNNLFHALLRLAADIRVTSKASSVSMVSKTGSAGHCTSLDFWSIELNRIQDVLLRLALSLRALSFMIDLFISSAPGSSFSSISVLNSFSSIIPLGVSRTSSCLIFVISTFRLSRSENALKSAVNKTLWAHPASWPHRLRK